MEAPADEPFPMPEHDWRGVDLSQIRQMLEMTPFERLEWLESLMDGIFELRERIAKAKVR